MKRKSRILQQVETDISLLHSNTYRQDKELQELKWDVLAICNHLNIQKTSTMLQPRFVPIEKPKRIGLFKTIIREILSRTWS